MTGDRDGTHAPFSNTYQAHIAHVTHVAARVLPLHDAQEVAQDTLLQHWLSPERYDPTRGSVATYLRVAARGRALDRIRSADASRRRDTEWSADRAAGLDGSDHDHGDDRREDLLDALRQLPPLQRQAIVTAFYGGLTYAEAAASLGVPEGTLKTRIRTGLAHLRSLLAPTGHLARQTSPAAEPLP